MENKFIVNTEFGNYDVMLEIDTYCSNDVVAIELIDCDGFEPFATLTVNICGYALEKNCSFLDTNNCPWAIDFITKNKLGELTGRVAHSGFCTYPEVRFNEETLALKINYDEMCMDEDEYIKQHCFYNGGE